MADGILLERQGIPAVAVCTDSFRVPAKAMADAYGFPGYSYVTVPHPVASLTSAQVSERAGEMVGEVVRILGVTQ